MRNNLGDLAVGLSRRGQFREYALRPFLQPRVPDTPGSTTVRNVRFLPLGCVKYNLGIKIYVLSYFWKMPRLVFSLQIIFYSIIKYYQEALCYADIYTLR